MGGFFADARRAAPLTLAALRRDIWLVVHPDLRQSARVRAVLGFLSEVIQRARPLLAGGGLLSEEPVGPGSLAEAESRVKPAEEVPVRRPSGGGAKRGKAASSSHIGQGRRGKAKARTS